ncbi:Rieske 2Fe-2S domain-containing protein [Nocardia sp. CDC160]|uniref:Rieske 2Fe-2S domain-containing protein n=1 Tax=Nocardia sp. CDC160 TaxID=3112166 RepID=UPI002DBA8524|nr:Rieske 2Fe-2S domain-containing protein [Nocardia sp. CDC160]MEC3915486.1 Rieske 2Fe-2S domain-containing protein [Nocardia sp. CDC160]
MNTDYPIGWFAVAFSSALAERSAAPVQAFGERLVAWRDEQGRAHLMDAYCPHLGAHLGIGGTVVGDALQCPFHGWRFDTAGRCVEVPYAKVKPAAGVRVWPVREQNGVILAWHGAPDRQPDWEMPVLDRDGWTPDLTVEWTLRGIAQDILENGVDGAHFKWVHKSSIMAATGLPEATEHCFRVDLAPLATSDEELPGIPLRSEIHGPGMVMAVHAGEGFEGCYRLYATPLDQERIVLRGLVSVSAAQDADPLNQVIFDAVRAQWESDTLIWDNKIHRPTPLLTTEERLIGQFRRWYRANFLEGEALAETPSRAG